MSWGVGFLENLLHILSRGGEDGYYSPSCKVGATLLNLGLIFILYTMFVWWRDVLRESTLEGDHTKVVQLGPRYGFIFLGKGFTLVNFISQQNQRNTSGRHKRLPIHMPDMPGICTSKKKKRPLENMNQITTPNKTD
ncbi:putative cytochrome-c oxidase [Helianthus annuus]|nr:putative cytochrome-c oxidase [Helianthus annuus]KAJ0636902.1 putative cytochrome-c oxidase [Helianthus annuus]